MNDPWHNRHPEWAQREAEQHIAAERASLRRMVIGLLILALIGSVMLINIFNAG